MREEKTPMEHLAKTQRLSKKPAGRSKKTAARINVTNGYLKELEHILQLIFENVSVGVLLADEESKKFLMGNRQIRESLGYEPDEISKLHLSDIHPEKDLPHIRDQFGKLMRNEIVVSKDIPVRRKDGSVYYADISVLPLQMRNRILAIGIFRDVSDRKRAEQDLKAAEIRHRALFEGANDAIFLIKDQRFIECNHMALAMYGCGSKEELLDRFPWDFSPGSQPDGRESKDKALEYIQAALRGVPQRFYWKHLRKDGTAFDAEVSLSSIDCGDQVFVQGIVRDITDRVRAENALKENEEKYRRIVDTANDGVWSLDADFINTFVNTRLAEMIGYRSDEIIGRRFREFLFEEDLPDHEKRVKARRQGVSERYERRLRHRDGHAVWGLISATPVFVNGRFQGSFAMVTDISERKYAEEALRESEERFRGLAESMTQLAWITDEKGDSLYHNPRFIEYTGLSNSTLEERLRIVHPDDRPVLLQGLRGATSSRKIFDSSYRMLSRDGVYRWFLTRIFLQSDAENRPVRWFGTATDINDLKEAEQALKENMALLAEAERIGHTGSWRRDLTTNQTFWSSSFRRIFGFAGNEGARFETLMSRVHPEDRDGLLKKMRNFEGKGEPFEVEYRIMLPDGTVRHIYDKGEITYSKQGKPLILHGFVLDMTERKRLEDELIRAQRLDSIGILAGGIAHDYNNLLTIIMGNLELARMLTPEHGKTRAFLRKAGDAAQSARDLTHQLITFSRGGRPIIKVMDIRNLIRDVVKLSLSGSNIKPVWKIADDLPQARVDANQIRLVIQNIVLNAREAMPGGGSLNIEARKAFIMEKNAFSLPGGIYLRVSFRDQGPGIPPENLSKVFDPYFTTKSKNATKAMGLGLSICYSVIKRHMGHISVNSEERSGTTVTIYIPAETEKEPLRSSSFPPV